MNNADILRKGFLDVQAAAVTMIRNDKGSEVTQRDRLSKRLAKKFTLPVDRCATIYDYALDDVEDMLRDKREEFLTSFDEIRGDL